MFATAKTPSVRDAPSPPRSSWRAGLLALVAAVVPAPAAGPAGGQMKSYETPYYVIYSDLDIDAVREAAVRITAMAEEYHHRTRGFSGTIRSKLPFYLFRSAEDYRAAGGPAGSVGVFMGNKLMAVGGEKVSARTWHTVQHEGFHQFARAVIRGDLPIWVNEGLAEYFGEGLYTGDLFVVGVVPPPRLARLKRLIEGEQVRPLRAMMSMSHEEWVKQLSGANYDQAWSMIQFLVHGEDGKYLAAMTGFMNDIGAGRPYEAAWIRNFGRDIDAFEKRWKEYWRAQPADPTPALHVKATVATLTSWFARAYSQQQRFETPEEFFRAAEAGGLKFHRENYLPPSLLGEALPKARKAGRWSIETPKNQTPRLVCAAPDGTRFVGSFALDGSKVGHINVEMVAPPEPQTQPAGPGPATRPATRPSTAPGPVTRPATAPATRPGADMMQNAINLARAYLNFGQKEQAREVLQEALKEYPDSPLAPQGRELLKQTEPSAP